MLSCSQSKSIKHDGVLLSVPSTKNSFSDIVEFGYASAKSYIEMPL